MWKKQKYCLPTTQAYQNFVYFISSRGIVTCHLKRAKCVATGGGEAKPSNYFVMFIA